MPYQRVNGKPFPQRWASLGRLLQAEHILKAVIEVANIQISNRQRSRTDGNRFNSCGKTRVPLPVLLSSATQGAGSHANGEPLLRA